MSKAGAGLERKIFLCTQSAVGVPVLVELVETSWGKWDEETRSLQSQVTV